MEKSTEERTLEDAEKVADYFLKNKLLPNSYKTKMDAVKAILLGRSIGLDDYTAIRSIDIIQGTPALSSRAMAGLMTKAGISIEILKDYEPIIESKPAYMLDDEGKPTFDAGGRVKCYMDYDGTPIIRETIIDHETVILVTRYYKNIGVVTTPVTMRLSWAEKAGWLTKKTWIELSPFLMLARCLSRSSRLVAADITSFLYSSEEVAEFTPGVEMDLDSEGEVVITQKE